MFFILHDLLKTYIAIFTVYYSVIYAGNHAFLTIFQIGFYLYGRLSWVQDIGLASTILTAVVSSDIW